jgi:hypothetical protein
LFQDWGTVFVLSKTPQRLDVMGILIAVLPVHKGIRLKAVRTMKPRSIMFMAAIEDAVIHSCESSEVASEGKQPCLWKLPHLIITVVPMVLSDNDEYA